MHNKRSTMITYTDGKAIEHLHYLPYGETQVDQRATSYAARYTFSAKEKDEETGYSYFGARYYNSDLSVWLSVDPMSDKYPNMSPYVYCADNPVKLVDPDGKEIVSTTEVNSDGSTTININYTAYIRNQSKSNISDEDLQKYANRITSSIKNVYGGSKEGNINVFVNCDIKVLSSDENNIDKSRHIITIADMPDGTSGESKQNTMEMWISSKIIDNKPDQENGLLSASVNGIGNSLERTAAHEFGHNAGLPDIETPQKNIMNQSDKSFCGLTVTQTQYEIIQKISDFRQKQTPQWDNTDNVNNKRY